MKKFTCALLLFLSGIMSLFARQPHVCFVTLHPGPAHHFAEFTKILSETGVPFEIYAGDFAETVLREKKIPHKRINVWTKKAKISELEQNESALIAKLLAHKVANTKVVITDISEKLMQQLLKELNDLGSKASKYVYYDNPQPFVNSCYSQLLEGLVKERPTGVIFANQNLARSPILLSQNEQIEFSDVEKIGIGFTPLNELDKLQELQKEKKSIRKKLFQKLKMHDVNQKVFLYLGGASSSYFQKGFPLFMQQISDQKNKSFFENNLLLLQQHPRAISQGNADANYIVNHKTPCFLSPLTTLESLSISDLTYYYQTSMSPKLLMGHYPLVQIASESDQDELVRAGLLPQSPTASTLIPASQVALQEDSQVISSEKIQEIIGFSDNWKNLFIQFINNQIN